MVMIISKEYNFILELKSIKIVAKLNLGHKIFEFAILYS